MFLRNFNLSLVATVTKFGLALKPNKIGGFTKIHLRFQQIQFNQYVMNIILFNII